MINDYGNPGVDSPHSDTPAAPRTNRHQNLVPDQPVLPACQPPDSGRHNLNAGPFDEHQLVTSALRAGELDDTFHCWHLVYIACISPFYDFSQRKNLTLISKRGMLYNHIAITER